MKKSFFLLAASLFAAAALALFASCSGDGGPAGFSQNGSVTFVFNDGVIKALKGSSSNSSSSLNASAAVSKSLAGIDDVSEYNIKVTLTVDGSDQTKETTMEAGREASVTFSDIAVGVKAKAAIKVLIDDFEYASGESDEITVAEGSNPLTIKARRATLYPIVLWNGMSAEKKFEYENKNGTNGNISAVNDKTYTRGAQIFGHVSPSSAITNPSLQIENDTNPVYCFGDDTLYWFYDGKIYTYAAPNYDQSGDPIDIKSKLDAKGVTAPNLGFNSVAYCDGYLFLCVNANYNHHFGAIRLSDQEVLVVSVESGKTSMQVKKESEGRYSLYSLSSSLLLKESVSITADGISIDTSSPTETSLGFPMESGEFFNSPETKMTDLQIHGDFLYVLLKAYTSGMSIYRHIVKEGEDEHYQDKFTVNSFGGVAKIDLTKSDFEWANWKNGKKYIGVYEDYYYRYDQASGEIVRSENAVAMTAPQNNSDKYFYGAQRFIAKKPDELVIADDGAYVDIDADSHTSSAVSGQDAIKACQNKNRVVTVNLLEESISAVDVGVCFNITTTVGTYFGISE